jgi:soluble lytic murein transglycosylase-like protein
MSAIGSIPAGGTTIGAIAAQAAAKYGIPVAVLLGLIKVESGGNIKAVSPTGAFGLTQFEPGTAAEYGVTAGDPVSQIFGAAHYLVDLGFHKDPTSALAKYNAGPAAGFLQRAGSYPADVLAAARNFGNIGSISVTAGGSSTPASSTSDSGGGLVADVKGKLVYGLLAFTLIGGGAILTYEGATKVFKPAGAPAGGAPA